MRRPLPTSTPAKWDNVYLFNNIFGLRNLPVGRNSRYRSFIVQRNVMSEEWVREEQNIYGEGLSVTCHAHAPLLSSLFNSPTPVRVDRTELRILLNMNKVKYDLPISWKKTVYDYPRGYLTTLRRMGVSPLRRTKSDTNLLLSETLAPPETKVPDLCPFPKPIRSFFTSQTLEFTIRRTRSPLLSTCPLYGMLFFLVPIVTFILSYGFRFMSFSIVAVMVFTIMHSSRLIVEESLLLITTIGVQLSQINVFGRTATKFLPISNIKAIIINETIEKQRIITYMAFLLNAPDTGGRVIIPIFQGTLPRRRSLETIYRGVFNVMNQI